MSARTFNEAPYNPRFTPRQLQSLRSHSKIVRMHDELRTDEGTYTVCRVDFFNSRYVCTNGHQTKLLGFEKIRNWMHYRNGVPVHADAAPRRRHVFGPR